MCSHENEKQSHGGGLGGFPAPVGGVSGAVYTGQPHSLSPSPGTPGEGWGEGSSSSAKPRGFETEPSPCSLPEYRERVKAQPARECGCPVPGHQPKERSEPIVIQSER